MTTVRVLGAREVLAQLKGVPKDLNKALREESKAIAARVMVPAWQRAAAGAGDPWSSILVPSIRARSDRQPAVIIGKRSGKLTRGADSIMVRYPSHAGAPGGDGTFDRAGKVLALSTFAPGSGWLDTTGVQEYGPTAMSLWGDAVERVCSAWNAGR